MVAVLLVAVAAAILAIVWRKRLLSAFPFWIPAVNLVADIGMGTDVGMSIHTGNIRGAVQVLFILLSAPRFALNDSTALVFAYVAYLGALIPLSSNVPQSAGEYLKVFASFLLFPIAYRAFNTLRDLRNLQKGLVVTLVIIAVHFTVTQMFGLGTASYVEDTVSFAGGGVFIAYVIAYAILGMPLSLILLPPSQRRRRVVYALVSVTSLIIMALVFRRGALLAYIGGVLAYLYFSPARGRRRMLKYASFVGVCAVLAAPLYLGTLTKLYQARGNIVGFVENTEEGRMAEFAVSYDAWVKGSLGHKLFGSDLFASRDFLRARRSLHVDYTTLFVGSGLIGMVLYGAMFAAITRGFFRRTRRLRDPGFRREMNGTFAALLVAFFVLSASRQISAITALSVAFLYLGALTGIAKHPDAFPDRELLAPPSPGRPPQPAVERERAS